MVVVVVVCISPGVATSAHQHAVYQEEVMLAITVNQLTLLKQLNTSSSMCASRK